MVRLGVWPGEGAAVENGRRSSELPLNIFSPIAPATVIMSRAAAARTARRDGIHQRGWENLS
jgi:hypothetical protein